MREYMHRPAGWSDESWSSLVRLADDSGSWAKPALHPEMFGFTSRGVAIAAYLLNRGVRVTPMPAVRGRAWVGLPIEGRSIKADLVRGELRELVGEFPDAPLVWRALATTMVDGRHVSERRGGLAVTVSVRWTSPQRHDPLDELSQRCEHIRVAVDGHGRVRGGGYAHLLDTFTRAGLVVPRLPVALRRRMRQVSDWCWTTERDDSATFDDYLFETASRIAGASNDHVTISHRGHGLSSYALTWRMVHGPLAMIVQDGWGGAFMEPGRAEGQLAELFDGVAGAVAAAEAWALREELPRGSWVRPIQLAWSPLRGIMQVRVWDPARGARVGVPIDQDEPWGDLTRLIEECPSPDQRMRHILDARQQLDVHAKELTDTSPAITEDKCKESRRDHLG